MLRPIRRAVSLLLWTAEPTLDRSGPVVAVRPQPVGRLPLDEESGELVEPGAGCEVVVELVPSGEVVELGWSGELVGPLEGDEVGGALGAGAGAGAGAKVVLDWALLPDVLEDVAMEEAVGAAPAVGACVRAGAPLVPVVELVAPLPLAGPPPPRPSVEDLPTVAPSPASRGFACPASGWTELFGSTAETAGPSSEPESAGRGSGANPIRLAESAASHPASATPSKILPRRTAR
jgi:hypothetical protein